MTIEQLFGTLQQSIVDIWRSHLKTDKYSEHMALDEYYKDMPELIDTLIENYMGRYGKVLSYENILNPETYSTPAEYLTALRSLVSETYETISASELKSDLDAILSQIDSTVYKLKELTEAAGEDVEFTLETGAGEPNKRLVESCKGCKKDKEEDEIVGKKRIRGKYKTIDGEEECEIKEAIVGKKSMRKKYSIIDKEEECETGKKVRESLAEYVAKEHKHMSLGDFLSESIF